MMRLSTTLIIGCLAAVLLMGTGSALGESGGGKLIQIQTLAGGNTFFVDANSIQNNSGTLQFGVLGFQSTDPDPSQGYSKSSASIDCRQGTYQASYASETVGDDGSTSSNGLHGSAAPMTLRNDGKDLYKNMKDLCKKYSGLDEDDMSSW